jgi:fructan beta-fructosidase
MKITKQYLNIPVGDHARMKLIELRENGKLRREFPVQLAEDTVSYWIYIDVSEFKGRTIQVSSHAKQHSLARIYQDERINGSDSLYKESNRPQFHFTVKRGWSNDINGPIFYKGQYHLFWQAFPFGKRWNTGFMYWGHATSKDLLHWEELAPALMLDSLGSPWSGTATVDRDNTAGWGKNALVLFYTAYDRTSFKQVQCIAYSTDGGTTFTHYAGNPVIDSNWELNTNDTRDPKVFWYEPAKQWVMVLFEKDVKGLFECPDFFELPVDGNTSLKKWVLHGGSSNYLIGTFDGKTFKPETEMQHYAEGKTANGEDVLYAAESFGNMPDGRSVQIAWGRVKHEEMPFTQMMLFPTEFKIITVDQGLKLVANPIKEIAALHAAAHTWQNLSVQQANNGLNKIKPGPLHVKMRFTIAPGNRVSLRYGGNEIMNMSAQEFAPGANEIEILIDKTVAEIFVNKGERYITKILLPATNNAGLEFDSPKYGPSLNSLEVYEMKSIWN